MERAQRESYGIVDFLVWPLLFAVLLVAADFLAGRRGIAVPDSFSGTVFYAALAAWLLYRAPRAPYMTDLATLSARPSRRTDWRLLGVVPLLVAVSGGAFYVVTLALSFVAPEVVAEVLAEPDPGAAQALPLLAGELVEAAIGAIAEEWLFRGVLVHLWARRFGVRLAVLATSVLFAALHADVIGSFIFGIVMAALYVRTGTLLVPIVTHLAFNACVYVGLALVEDDEALTLAEFREDWWMGVVAFVVGLAAIVVVVRRVAPRPWRLPDVPAGQSAL